MSWKDINIAKKLYIGFGIVLVLTVVVGIVSINGFNQVKVTMLNSGDANQLVRLAKDGYIARRDFLLTGDKKHAEKLHTVLGSDADKVLDQFKSRVTDQAGRDKLDEARSAAADWVSIFDKWSDQFIATRTAQDNLRSVAARIEESCGSSRSRNSNMLLSDFRACQATLDGYLSTQSDELARKFESQMNTLQSKYVGADNAVMAGLTEYRKNFSSYRDAQTQVVDLVKPMAAAAEKFMSLCDEMRKNGEDEMAKAQSAAVTLVISFIIGAVLIGLAVAFFIARGVSQPIAKVVAATQQMNREFADFERVMQAIAENDLTHKVHQSTIESIGLNSKDEIGTLVKAVEATLESKAKLGNSMTRMTENLTGIIMKLTENARELVSASTQIASSSEEMSKGAKDQADQVNQVSTAVEEMTATILESSKNAGEATNAAKGASDTATTGGRIVNDTIQGMQKIAGVVRESAQSIGKLAKSADQIGEIIGVIDDIADQTNLLALNAAIEAARAGEQGRGFAVVADEVRKLAERTGKATGEITEMIKGIQKETEEAVHSMEAGIQQVDKGRELADKAGNSLNEIVTMAQRVTDMISQMATASEEQSSAAEQISKNIEHISSVTKETATGADQSAAAAEELNRQADGLQQIVQRFKVTA
ncbi:MAG TPA: methyl-accepting chemotaxis protein [Candidatus Acidoferrum sp.]|nr:methyl-accepting chemotaxis protein [Candidatus Acidoferrum sp.]